MIYPNYVKQSPVLGLTSGAAGGASLSYFTHTVSSGGGGDSGLGSVLFDGNGDYLEVSKSTDFDFGGAFTMEAWVYADSLTTDSSSFNALDSIFESIDWNSQTGQYSFGISHENKLYFYIFDGNNTFYYGTTVLSTQQWYHLAVSRDGSGNIRLFVNGELESTNSNSYSLSNSNQPNPARIGGCKINNSGSGIQKSFDGYITNLHVLKGTALYTSSFTPSSASLTAVTNTKLLCCKSTTSVTNADVIPGSGTITSNGNPEASSSTPFSGGSVLFNGSSLQIASTADLCPGTNDFTFECWLRPAVWGSSWETVYQNGVYNGLFIGKDDSGNFVVRASSNTSFITQSTLPSVNQWTHIAVTRQGSTLKLFYNGVLKNSVSNSHNFPTAATAIAQTTGNGEGINGRISNLRFIKGTAVYTSNFTVPTASLTDITNTKLLCCQTEGPVTSAAVTPLIITTNGNPEASTSSPFSSGGANTSGSLLLDGTDDYIIVPDDADLELGNSDFTIEAFIKPTGSQGSGFNNLFTKGWELQGYYKSDGAFTLYSSTTGGSYDIISGQGLSAGSISLNTWQHLAICRSGNTWKIFVDGVQGYSASHSGTIGGNTSGFAIGDFSPNAGQYEFQGYISNFRVIKGTALYTSNFTPPTSALTNVTNTKLLCCQSDTSPTAATVTPGTITSNGNPQASSSNPFSVGSVSFDGTTDCLTIADNTDFEFGSGNFTLEAFIKYTGNPGTGGNTYVIASKWDNQNSNKGFILRISDDGGGDNLQWLYSTDGSSNNITTGSTVLSPGTWYHIAFVRNGSTGTFYIDGVADSSTQSFSNTSIKNTTVPFRIGANLDVSAISQEFNGLISNFRVIKGTALYTSNFTAPTSALTNVTNTKLLCCQSPFSATAATVTPGTITSNGNPQASSSTPFLDLPSSAVFYATGQDFNDRGPNAYTITKVGSSLSAGNSTSKSGNGSFDFNGSDTQQYFYAGNNTFLDDSLSSWQFQCWARYNNTSGQAGNSSGDMGMLVDQYPGSGSQGRLLFGFQSNQVVMRVNGGTVELTSGSILSNNTWYHVLLNWDGTTHRLFTDGILRDSSTTVPAIYTGKRTEFGGGGDLGGYNLHGYMEHVLVENGGTVKTSNFTVNPNGFVT